MTIDVDRVVEEIRESGSGSDPEKIDEWFVTSTASNSTHIRVGIAGVDALAAEPGDRVVGYRVPEGVLLQLEQRSERPATREVPPPEADQSEWSA